MMQAIRRKLGHLAADPVLRRWLLERAMRLTSAPAPFAIHRPPYLTEQDLRLQWTAAARPSSRSISAKLPAAPLKLTLPGAADLVLTQADPSPLFGPWDDLETQLAIHRFSWLAIAGPYTDPSWVALIWEHWRQRYGIPDQSWAWHPYTAAERASILLDYFHRHGFPPGSQDLLAAHAGAIIERLEYFGDHYTGNHLANNGRGLYLLGLSLEWQACADLGWKILHHESRRLFGESGVLNEQSSHYHLLLTRNLLSCWLAALRRRRPEAACLRELAVKAYAVLAHFDLPGGFPLVGDISPDCPPAFLTSLLPSGTLDNGWAAWLDENDKEQISMLRRETPAADSHALLADGWLRHDHGDWCGLWHASPLGWPAMPGHAHQDMGSAQLHWRGQPVFIDPGRGAYGEEGDAALYRSAGAHGLLQLDDADPYPIPRPYYDDAFRRKIGGDPPSLQRLADGVELRHHGFRRQGASTVRRRWQFNENGSLTIEDQIDGRGKPKVTRQLVCPWPVRRNGDGLVIMTPAGMLGLSADVVVETAPLIRWSAYGQGEPATLLRLQQPKSALPWHGEMHVFPL